LILKLVFLKLPGYREIDLIDVAIAEINVVPDPNPAIA
jgi:hypothetical protein